MEAVKVPVVALSEYDVREPGEILEVLYETVNLDGVPWMGEADKILPQNNLIGNLINLLVFVLLPLFLPIQPWRLTYNAFIRQYDA